MTVAYDFGKFDAYCVYHMQVEGFNPLLCEGKMLLPLRLKN